MSDHAPLLAFIDALRAKGVRTFKGPLADSHVELELGPPVPVEVKAEKVVEADLCGCGHKTWEHGDRGLCLFGCEPEKCEVKT